MVAYSEVPHSSKVPWLGGLIKKRKETQFLVTGTIGGSEKKEANKKKKKTKKKNPKKKKKRKTPPKKKKPLASECRN